MAKTVKDVLGASNKGSNQYRSKTTGTVNGIKTSLDEPRGWASKKPKERNTKDFTNSLRSQNNPRGR